MRIDERTDKSLPVRAGYEAPSISIDSRSVAGYALHGFLLDVSLYASDRICDLVDHEQRRKIYESNGVDFLSNTGNAYRNDAFAIHAYDWDETWVDEAFDDALGDIPPGYLHPNSDCFYDAVTGAAVSWYKSFGRGVSVNQAMLDAIERDGLADMLSRVSDSIEELRERERT